LVQWVATASNVPFTRAITLCSCPPENATSPKYSSAEVSSSVDR
jgi:hypothetical protein